MATRPFTPPSPAARQPLRTRRSLDGVWDFRLDREEHWRAIEVPGVWQAQFDDLRETQGVTWYRRNFQVPPELAGGELVIGFGAVNYLAEVFVNGRRIAAHEGGYLGFEAKLPPELIWDDNLLEVMVTLPSNDSAEFPDHPFQEIPHGKQSWYGPMGGIWQSVFLERRDPAHIVDLQVVADLPSRRVTVEVTTPDVAAGATVRMTVLDAGRANAGTVQGPRDEAVTVLSAQVARPKPWSPDHPHLYTVRVELLVDDAIVDSATRVIGFRTIETRDGRFILNGQPLYLRCALDQDYYPDGLYTLPNLEYLEDQMKKAKQLGLNSVRCHIKVPDPLYYEVCDRLGLLVWTEFPNFERFSDRAAARARETAEGIIRRDGHHPAIIAWTIINEDWGTRLTEDPDHRRWLIDQYDWLKLRDPTRLAVDNSACFPNFHVKTDIEDYHYYRGVPDRRVEWDHLTESFAGRKGWTFSPHGDAQPRGDEPLVCSEFGVWGLPNPRDLRRGGNVDPWWFSTGEHWGDGVAHPRGLEGRYRALFLDRAFGSFDRFIGATQWYQFVGLKYQIERLREHASIQGYVITELTDIYWESNGLMDMERNLRAFHAPFADINADLVILPGFTRWSFRAGETLTCAPKLATGGATLGPAATLEWRLEPLGLSGTMPVPATPPARVLALPTIAMPVPDIDRALVARLTFTLFNGRGNEIATNYERVSLFPTLRPATDVAARIHCPVPDLAARLTRLGFTLVDGAEDAELIVGRGMDTALVEKVRRGCRALVIFEAGESAWLRTDQPPSLLPVPYHMDQAFPGLFAQARDNTIYRGDWITAFSWLQRKGPFAAIPSADDGLAPMFDLAFEGVVPHHVLQGLKPWEWEAHAPAGLVVGWGHKGAAIVCERWFGRGKAVATTFRVSARPAGADPLAEELLGALVRQALAG